MLFETLKRVLELRFAREWLRLDRWATLLPLIAVCFAACVTNAGSDDVSASRQSVATAVYQIDCGGPAVSPFSADQFFSGGTAYSSTNTVSTAGVANAAPAAVYQTERFGNQTYTFGNLTPSASYVVRLHFAEIYFSSAGSREFNVIVNGTQVLTRLDIFATVGANKALVYDFATTASSAGQITIQYVNVIENAKSSGIEILSTSANQTPTVATAAVANPNPVPGTDSTASLSVLGADDGGEPSLTYTWAAAGAAPVSFSANGSNGAKNTIATFGQPGTYSITVTIRDASGASTTSSVNVVVNGATTNNQVAAYQVDCGGDAVGAFAGDEFFSGGTAFSSSNTVSTAGVANAAPAAVYQSERFGNHTYTLGSLTPNGSYTVRLHFAEIYFTSAGSRQFNVVINGTQVLTNLDIFATVGANTALVRDFPTTASSAGQITIQYVNVIENAKSSGIEILSSSGTTSQTPTVASPAAASPNPLSGVTSALSVLGADDGGEANLTYTWAVTGTPPAPVSFSENGSNAAKNTTVRFAKAGNYALGVTIRDAGGASIASSVVVTVNQTATSAAVAPASASVAPGGSQQFSATASDQFGNPLAPEPAFSWSVSGGGSVDASGRFASNGTAGSFTITAAGGGRSATGSISVAAAKQASCPAGSICVDPTTRLQTIDGFGGAIAYNVPFVATDASAQFLFSTNNDIPYGGGSYPGIGLTLIRVGMLPDGTVGSSVWPSVTKALSVNPNILVWGAPWSPTASFKTTGNVTSGSLRTDSYDAWANVLATNFVNGARAAGVNIYAVSAQNEPDFDTQGQWNMCLYSPAQMTSFIDVLGPKLHALSPPVKLIAAESECWSCAQSYFSAITSDPTALAQTDILAAHDYTYAAQATQVPSGKRLWETEVSDVNQPWDATMTMGLWGAKRIHDNLTTASVNAFHWWWFDNFGATQGLIGGNNAPPKLAFAFGNYSRFVRPGFTRVSIAGSIPTGVDATAFVGSSGQLVVVLINENGSSSTVTLGVNGSAPASLTPWVTSASDNLAAHSAIALGSGGYTVTLSAQSVTTLVSP